MKKYLAGFLVLASVSAQAKLFTITNRNYGTLTAPQITALDTALDALEASVNTSLPNVDTSTYMSGSSKAAIAATAGNGVDYTSTFSWFTLGATGGVGVTPGAQSLSHAFTSSGFKTVEGVGAGVNIMAGLNFGIFSQGYWGGIFEPKRFKLYLGFFGTGFDSNSNGTATKFDTSSFSVIGQYKLWGERSFGARLLKWNGVDVSSGFRTSSINFSVTQTINQSQSIAGLGTATFSAPVKIGADVTTTTIPIEVSTSARVFYFWNFFSGLATDLAFGGAKSNFGGSGPITLPAAGGASATGALAVAGEGGPSLLNVRYFLGTGVELGIVNLYLQFNHLVTAGAYGVNAGVHMFW